MKPKKLKEYEVRFLVKNNGRAPQWYCDHFVAVSELQAIKRVKALHPRVIQVELKQVSRQPFKLDASVEARLSQKRNWPERNAHVTPEK